MSRTFTEHWKDYELIDAGNNKKLERFGNVVTIRPDRNAYFKPELSEQVWKQKADFEFIEQTNTSGDWKKITNKPDAWQIQFEGITLNLKLTKFKHVGVFPEQRSNWDFVKENLNSGDKFLNLFGYTGAVSLMARKKGADVYHCDSIKQIISWGKENMESSGLSDIHWILEDAVKFAQREVKRGKKYQGIIMDPPAFGLGANKERWKIEDKFIELLELGKALMDDQSFLIVNTYSPRLNIQTIQESVDFLFPDSTSSISKLSIKSTTGKIIEYGELSRINNDF